MQETPAGQATAYANRTDPTVTVTRGGVSAADHVSRVVVKRELVGDLPDVVSLLAGSAAATATLEVDGAATSLHPLHPADAASVLASPVVVRAGYGGTTVPVFTGRVSEFTASDSDRRLTWQTTDGSVDTRAPVTLPALGERRDRWGNSRLPVPTNLSAVVVAALHAGGVRVTPPADSRAVLSVPLVAGMVADEGAVQVVSAPVATPGALAAGRWGAVPADGCRIVGTADHVCPWAVGTGVGVELWINYSAATADRRVVELVLNRSGARLAIVVGGTGTGLGGRVWGQITTTGSTWSALSSASAAPQMTTAGWHRIALFLTWDGVVQTWVDTALVSGTVLNWPTSRPAAGPHITLGELTVDGTVQALHLYHWTDGFSVQPTSTTFTAQADVDTAALSVDVLPLVEGRDAWDLLREVAAAELGSVEFTESGRFRFRSRATLNGGAYSGVQLSTTLVPNVRSRVDLASIRTKVTARLKPRWFAGAMPGPTPTAVAAEVLTLPIGTSSHTISSARPWWVDSTIVSVIANVGAAFEVPVGMAVCSDPGGATRYTGGNILATLTPTGPRTATLTVTNTSGATRYACWPAEWTDSGGYPDPPFGFTAGSAAVWVNGYGLPDEKDLPDDPLVVENAAAVATWGSRLFELPDSPWRQSVSAVTALAGALLADLSTPRPTIDPVTIPADPRLQLGDVLEVDDPPRKWEPFDAMVVSITTTIDNLEEGRMTQTLRFRAVPG